MAWTTGAALLQWAADTLKVDISALPPLWANVAQDSVDSAYQDLLSAIGSTAYSGTQIATSDQAANWNLQYGLFKLAGEGGGFGQYDEKFFDRFDILEKFKAAWKDGTFSLTFAGMPIAPDGSSAVGGIKFGQAVNTATPQQVQNRFFRYGQPWGGC